MQNNNYQEWLKKAEDDERSAGAILKLATRAIILNLFGWMPKQLLHRQKRLKILW